MTSKFNPNVKKRTEHRNFIRILQSIALLGYTFFSKSNNVITMLIGIVVIVSLYQLVFSGIIEFIKLIGFFIICVVFGYLISYLGTD